MGCKIDAKDLPKVDAMPNTWWAQWDQNMQDHYAAGRTQTNGERRTILMHRLITDAPAGLPVDHRNHSTLDNRRENLRVTTRSGNGMNRRGANQDSVTGHRAIHYYPKIRKYVVRPTIDGKQKHVGCFSTIDEAIVARNRYPGYARSA